MSEKLKDDEIVSFKEILTSNSIQLDSLAQLLIKKELNTENEFFRKLKEVQAVEKITDQ